MPDLAPHRATLLRLTRTDSDPRVRLRADALLLVADGRSLTAAARADLLAPDLRAVAAIVEAGTNREAAVRAAVAFSTIGNGVGAVWGLRGRPGIERTSYAMYAAIFGAPAAGWARLRGGERPISAASGIADPHPERWGRRSAADVLHAFDSTDVGLTTTTKP